MERLKINILRGENKIGENLIEITDGKTEILLECGIPLEETDGTATANEKVVSEKYDAIVISHSHIDHAGLLSKDVQADKIYMGKDTLSILKTSGRISENNINKCIVFTSNESFSIGGIEITPFLCDHSAFDSYMILIRSGNDKILYTGDYRSSGRKNFNALLTRLPNHVDCLITEGTNLTRTVAKRTETELEREATKLIGEYKHVFILQSVTNVDRTVSFYKATLKNDKKYILNLSMAKYYKEFKNIPDTTYKNCYTYLAKAVGETEHDEIVKTFGKKLLSERSIAKADSFAMQINPKISNYLLKLKELGFDFCDSVFIYSTWNGYKETFAKEIIETFEKLGVKTVDLHVSGHADKETIEKLINAVSPEKVVFVHTDGKTVLSESFKEELKKDRFKEAVEIAIKYGQCGESLLQRKMNIDFYEATHYIELMADFGILGDWCTFESRKCLIESLKKEI